MKPEPASSSYLTVIMLGPNLSWPGGMTAVVHTLRRAGLFNKFDITYIETYFGPGALLQIRSIVLAVWRLVRMLAHRRVSLIHAHCASRGSFWRKALLCGIGWIFKIPYILHIHSGEFPRFYHLECNAIAKWCVRRVLSNAETVVCLAVNWQLQLSEIEPNAKLLVVGNPVEVGAKLTSMRSPPKSVLFMGRLRQTKGVFDLLQAIPIVLIHFPALIFVFAGDDLANTAQDYAKTLKVEANVKFLGWIDGAEKAAALRDADIFVLPSYFEGLPMGILESMAVGPVVIATAVGGIPDLVRDGKDGILIEPGNVDELASAIIRVCEDHSMVERMRRSAYSRVKNNYEATLVVEAISNLYQSASKQGLGSIVAKE